MSSRECEKRADVWGLQLDADMLILLIIENKLGVDKVNTRPERGGLVRYP